MGDLHEGSLGLGLVDMRGWQTTRTGSAIDGLEQASDWRTFSGVMWTRDDARALRLLGRMRARRTPLTGRVELRDIRVSPVDPFPAYPVVTCAASLSGDGQTLYLILFNKHDLGAVDARVAIEGFTATSARAWTVTGPSLEATNLEREAVRETASGVAVQVADGRAVSYELPPRSMTAIELYREQ